jgi:oligopeptide/dipeptide ABC transporter ATP-binding protein
MNEQSPPLLSISDLKVWFPIQKGVLARTVGYIRAVDGVSLDIGNGEVLGLVGESGCGKSTLARSIMLLEPPHAGQICYQGQQVLGMNRTQMREYRRQVQVVFQDPFAALNPRLSILDILTEGPLQHGLISKVDAESHGAQLLRDVGLNEDAMYRYPHEFSGGQRQRICIARALSVKPKLLVCDEAVSALDVSVQAQVLNLLKDLKEKYGLSYLFITHDLHVVRFIADRIAVMYLGRLVEEGTRGQLMATPAHPYTKALLDSAPQPGGARGSKAALPGETPSASNPPSGCRFHPRCPIAADICSTVDPEELSVRGHKVHCHRATFPVE